MEASLSSSILTAPISNTTLLIRTKSSTLNLTCRVKHSRLIRSKSLQVRNVAGIEEVSAAADAAPAVGVTWQIVVGALVDVWEVRKLRWNLCKEWKFLVFVPCRESAKIESLRAIKLKMESFTSNQVENCCLCSWCMCVWLAVWEVRKLRWDFCQGILYAGATPFVVAGIEFSKRIIAQRTCDVCGGSGLVLKKENYVRCPGCGGFLPWQSWKRFFSG